MSLEPNQARKLAAKRTNERVKLVASSMNTLAIGIIVAAIIVPGVSSPASLLDLQRLIWLIVAAALHMVAQTVLGLLRSED